MSKNKIFSLKYLFIIVLQLVFGGIGYAQKTNQELVHLINQKTTPLEDKCKYLCEFGFRYFDYDTVKAYNYGNKALQIAKKLDSPKMQAYVYEYLSIVARMNKNIPKQIQYADECLLQANKANDDEAMAYANFAIAGKYNAIEEKEKCISLLLKSLAYFEKNKIRYDKLVLGYAFLAEKFIDRPKNIGICEKYIKKSFQLSIESKDSILVASALGNLGFFISEKSNKDNKTNFALLDSAETCYKKAIKIFDNNKNKTVLNYFYGGVFLNLSGLYLYNRSNINKNKTLHYLKKAEEVCLKINNSRELMIAYGQQADYYANTNDIANIEIALTKVEQYIKKQIRVDPRFFVALYENYMDLATRKNDFAAYRKYQALSMKAYNEMNEKQFGIKEYNATVRFEIKEKENKILNLQKTRNLFIVLTILGFLLLFFIIRSYNFRKKAYIKEKQLLQKATIQANLLSKLKEEEAVSSMLEAELSEKERQMAIQEKILTEQQKADLQQELMTNNLQLEKKNEVLKEIQDKLLAIKSNKDPEIKNLSKTIENNISIDSEFELLKTNFKNSNPEFFATLQERAIDTLTPLDLKYCAYIKLGMATKDIANLMHIEPKSMRMARYRIKQKLNLDKNQDLDEFIKQA